MTPRAAAAALDGPGRRPALELRRRACARLAGCTGRRAVEALVAALDDPAATVRKAAVSALAQTAAQPGHGWRLAHAAFHRRAEVRAAAVAEATVADELLVALLDDDDAGVRSSAREAARDRVRGAPALVGHLLVARRRGIVDEQTVRDLLLDAPWRDAGAAILRLLPRLAPPMRGPATGGGAGLDAAMQRAGDDTLVDLISLIGADEALGARVIDGLARGWRRRHLDVDDRQRLAGAIAVVAAMGGQMPTTLLALGVAGDVEVLGVEAIPLADRRRALAAVPALRLPGAHDAFDVARAVGLLPAVSEGADGERVALVAGLVALQAEDGWTHALASLTPSALAEATARAPCPALLARPPAGGSERAAWLAFLKLVAVILRQLPADEVIDVDAWWHTLCVLPADALFLVEDLVEPRPGLAQRLLLRALDRRAAGPLLPDEALVEHDLRRVERALDALMKRCGDATKAGVVRVAVDDAVGDGDRSGGRALVAAFCRTTDLEGIAAVLDGFEPRRRQVALEVALQAAPGVKPHDALTLALRHPDSPTLVALARRDLPPQDLDGHGLAQEPWEGLAATVVRRAQTARTRGVADVVITRAAAGDVPPATVADAVVGALLASWDPPHRTARAIAAVAGGATAASPGLQALRSIPTALLPPLAAALVDADGADERLATLLEASGGLRAQVELALSVEAPWALWWLAAVRGHLARRAASDPVAVQRVFADGGLRRLAADIVSGAIVVDDDPRRPGLLAILSPALPSPPPEAPPRWEAPLAALLDACAAGVPEALAWADGHSDEEVADAIEEALIIGAVAVDPLQALARRLSTTTRERVVREALRVTVAGPAQTAWLRLLPLQATATTTQALQGVLRWGSRQALQLCGAPFAVALSADGLGHTRIGRRRVVVNPLPLLQAERDGDAIVRGLILHELGHHRHHGGDVGLGIWRQAQDEGLHALLNLVADEHLERNLRALSPRRYGGPLKTLAAWAFQHMHREVSWAALLAALGPRARVVLTGQRPGVARRPDEVRVDVGTALGLLDRRGSSISRFMRALRMGRADTSGDPKVKEAMALFPAHRFRASTMPELLAIARRLRLIFGDETAMLEVFDFHRLTDASGEALASAGVDTDAITPEAPTPRPRLKGPPRGASRGRPGGRGINVDDDTAFEPIDAVERVPADVARHRQMAALVRRPASHLRRHLLLLGHGAVVERRRLSGRRLDRGALVGSVLRGDPRLLASRRTLPSPDVFVGVAIDCSGSMDGEHLERAMGFAVLLAEAVRGLPDIDARFFGFTDDRIFDAGDARRCAVTSLEADGGNNDAAALDHVARVARASRRRATLLVMISDGAPTECSVPALRALVERLETRGMLCAQVAVEAIDDDDICFRRHILLQDDDLVGAARRFGVVLESLLAAARSHGHSQPGRSWRSP